MNNVTTSEKATWLNQFNNKISKHASALNISPSDCNKLRQNAVVYNYVANEMEVLKPWAERKKSYTEFISNYQKMETNIFGEVKSMISKIHDHPMYSQSMETELNTLNFERLMNGYKPFTIVHSSMPEPMNEVVSEALEQKYSKVS